ncbi:hypothetical protein PIB30_088375 [Stylosanthes scabra]|uniref:Uncharacterized protein n=1 Tax=Stylosanthes scabra TaxID=79078 RepID=A0ABU6SUS3_9FABA|nr:hypothetical protein [Stylosanthes scabra]
MVKENVSKKGKALRKLSKPRKDGKPKKDERWKSPQKIRDVLGMSSTGTPFPDKVIAKVLSEEDQEVHKFFQRKTQATLADLIMDTPINTVENKRLFMRAFLLFIQKCFLLATFSANVTPRAYPALFNVENTKQRNWALHVHNFLIE